MTTGIHLYIYIHIYICICIDVSIKPHFTGSYKVFGQRAPFYKKRYFETISNFPISSCRFCCNVMTRNDSNCLFVCYYSNVSADPKPRLRKDLLKLGHISSNFHSVLFPNTKNLSRFTCNGAYGAQNLFWKNIYSCSCDNFSKNKSQPGKSSVEQNWFRAVKAYVLSFRKDAPVFQSLRQRLVAGFSLGFLAIVSIFAGDVIFTIALTLICVLGQLEYYRMARAKGHLPAHRAGIIVGILQNITAYAFPAFADTVFPIGGTLICCYLLFRKRQATIADISTSFMGLFYAGYLPSYWIRLHALRKILDLGPHSLTLRLLQSFSFLGWKPLFSLGACLTFWTWLSIVGADVGAYFTGKLFGRTMFIEISPKKTVEGALGGFLGSTCISLLGAYLLRFPFWYITGAVYGMMIGVVGLLGDLTASLFKRDAGVKDSGNIIPGHGGILDRTDSYVFTAPLVYYFVTILLPIIVNIFV